MTSFIGDEEKNTVDYFRARRAFEVDLLLSEPELIHEPKPFACERRNPLECVLGRDGCWAVLEGRTGFSR